MLWVVVVYPKGKEVVPKVINIIDSCEPPSDVITYTVTSLGFRMRSSELFKKSQ